MLYKSYRANKLINGLLSTIVKILILLTFLSGILLTIRLADYRKPDEREIRLTSNLHTGVDLFSVEYENESGQITVCGTDGNDVVAPGTSVEYTLYLRNSDTTALDCEMVPEVNYTSDFTIPIYFRLLDEDCNYIIGDAQHWVAAEDIPEISCMDTLLFGESTEYYFQWKWEFEEGDDAYDTFLGANAKEKNIGLSLKLNLFVEANAEIGMDDAVVRSELKNVLIAAAAFLVLGATSVLAIVALIKKRKFEII